MSQDKDDESIEEISVNPFENQHDFVGKRKRRTKLQMAEESSARVARKRTEETKTVESYKKKRDEILDEKIFKDVQAIQLVLQQTKTVRQFESNSASLIAKAKRLGKKLKELKLLIRQTDQSEEQLQVARESRILIEVRQQKSLGFGWGDPDHFLTTPNQIQVQVNQKKFGLPQKVIPKL